MSELGIGALSRNIPARIVLTSCVWIRSRWLINTLISIVIVALLVGIRVDAPVEYLLGQVLLGTSCYISLFLLADRPLINPIQAVVAVFYFWFGVGPAVISCWNYFLGMPDIALQVQVAGMESLYLVAAGLPIYALIARYTVGSFSRTGIFARFLLPKGENYSTRVLIIYVSLSLLSSLLLHILPILGIHGIEGVDMLGGTKTSIWWVGGIAAVGLISPFITSSLIMFLPKPWKAIPVSVKVLILVVVSHVILNALTGGWKGTLAFMGAYYLCAYVSKWQRPPWKFMVIGIFIFLLFIAPYVTHGRYLAELARVSDDSARKQIFSEILRNPRTFLPSTMRDVNPAVFFRGIYPLAGEIVRRNGLFDGEWDGYTIDWGVEILVPRVFNPDKRDMNIGNFFSQTVGADLGVTNADDYINNISVTIPLEMVGNYGLLAGVCAFGVIGLFWSLLCVWILSPARLSNHPLTPYMVLLSMGMEAAWGHYLIKLRGLVIPFIMCYLVYRVLRGKI